MRILIAGVAACAVAFGAAQAETRQYDLDGFEAVAASSGVEMRIVVGEDFAIEAESSERELDRLRVEVDGGELSVGRGRGGRKWRKRDPVRVSVSLPRLIGVDVSSGAEVDATGVDADDFALEASSGGEIDVAGRCGALNADASSGGRIDAERLECREADVDASSGGAAVIFAGERVDADASSGASVSVHGDPRNVSKSTSSGGNVTIK